MSRMNYPLILLNWINWSNFIFLYWFQVFKSSFSNCHSLTENATNIFIIEVTLYSGKQEVSSLTTTGRLFTHCCLRNIRIVDVVAIKIIPVSPILIHAHAGFSWKSIVGFSSIPVGVREWSWRINPKKVCPLNGSKPHAIRIYPSELGLLVNKKG